MTELELLRLIKKGESQTVSLKGLKTKPSVLARSMVSFSNSNDGLLIIGVDDKTRKICGAKTVREKEECLDNIHRAAKQCCEPNVDIPRIEEVETADGIVFITYIPKYPYLVIREAIANAVTHREYHPFIKNGMDILWFSDRIEILNPGLLLDPITPENIYIVRNKQRNSNIARILTGYGYTEQVGEGMQLFKRECDRHPIKPKYPEYKEWIDATVTILYPAEVGVPKKEEISLEGLNERQKRAIEYIKKNGDISNKVYRDIFAISPATAKRELMDLVDRKIFKVIGAGPSSKYIIE